MLSFPYAFQRAGFGIAVATLCVLGILSNNAIMVLSSSQKHVKLLLDTDRVSYTDTVRVLLGKHWRNLTATCILCSQIGVSIGYEIFICNTFEAYFSVLSYNAWLLVLQPPLIIFCAFRSLRWLSVVSFAGLLCLWFGTALSMWLMCKNAKEHGWAPEKPVTDIQNYALFLGLAALAFEGLAAVALTIEQSMENPDHFPRIVRMAIVFITVLECSFGVLGCLSFGSTADQVITRSFSQNAWTTALSILFSLELVFTFPGNLYPVWKFLEEITFGPKPPELQGIASPRLSHVIFRPNAGNNRTVISRACIRTLLRSAVVIGMAVVSFLCRDSFAKFLSLVGSIACAAVIFLIPALLQFQLVERWSCGWFSAVSLLTVGIIAPIAGVASTFLT